MTLTLTANIDDEVGEPVVSDPIKSRKWQRTARLVLARDRCHV